MDKNQFGKYVATKRKEKSLTQQELAEKIGVSSTAVSHWERGKCYPDVELFAPLAELLGVKVNELLKGQDAVSRYLKEAQL